MNDYTKNISESIFTPGVYKQSNTITDDSRAFVKTNFRRKNLKYKATPVKGEDQVRGGSIGDNAYKKLFEHRVTGMRATLSGKLGEKKIDRINRNVNEDYGNPYLTMNKV